MNNFTNRYADLYSLGGLDIAANDQLGRASVVENISATLESGGNMRVSAQRLDNRTEVYSLGRELISGYIAIRCYDCSGDHYNVDYVAKEFYQGSVLDDSPSAFITAGGNFNFIGGDLFNRQSSVAAAGDIAVQANNFSNIGAIGGSIERTRIYNSGRVTDGTVERFVASYVTPYNQRNNPEFPDVYYADRQGDIRMAIAEAGRYRDGGGSEADWVEEVRFFDSVTDARIYLPFSYGRSLPASQYDPNNLLQLPSELAARYALVSDLEVASDGGEVRSAIVQAGGDVSIQAAQSLENSVIHQDYQAAVGASRVGDTAAQGTGTTTFVRLNAQLPPDLQQQQVNPLSLPGFSLPQGENGLFRLSGQTGQNAAASSAQGAASDRTLSGRSITLAQREQSLDALETQGRNFAVASQGGLAASQVEGSTWSLANSSGNPLASGSATHIESGGVPASIAANAPSLPTLAPLPGSAEPIKRTQGEVSDIRISGQTVRLDSQPVTGATPIGVTALAPTAAQTEIAIGTPEAQLVTQAPGMPAQIAPAKAHPYLIETNPELTNLKQFLGSDYLLGNLGITPDNTQKRLGDGLYEQRLIREAVVARTGQRFLAGLTSDEALFRHLMDNALASKQALNLSLGVSLSAEQVAALTHDIVWLEEYEVNGEKVLVPVLYLAQAKGRLAPNGALIQGQDVALISGGSLTNQGTLRASHNLSAVANGLDNRGLIEAGKRLDLLATTSIRNAQGGIIKGRDVSLIALTGDVLNERTVTRHEVQVGNRHEIQDFADSAARIEAANSLSIGAGRDIANRGGVLDSRGDLRLSAGRDVTLASVEERRLQARGKNYLDEHVTQLGATVTAGRDIRIDAGRDLSVIASQIDARRDIALTAGEDVTLAAAANEDHFLSKSKKVTRQTDHIEQQATEISAGSDVSIAADGNLALIASKVAAGGEAYLVAGEQLSLLAAENLDHSYYFKKKKGSFGRSSSKMSASTTSTAVVSTIEAGQDLTLSATHDLQSQGANLTSEGALLVYAGHDIDLGAAENFSSQESAKSKKGLTSSKSRSNSNSATTLTGTSLNAQSIDMLAGNDLTLEATSLLADGAAQLSAGRDINIVAGEQSQSSSSSKQSSKIGFAHHALLAQEQKGQQAQQISIEAVGSTLSAASLQLDSGRDSHIQGSTLVADSTVAINAGRDLLIDSAESRETTNSKSSSRKTGEIGKWWQGAFGSVKQSEREQGGTVRQVSSQIASLEGDISLKAGEQYRQTASQVLALQGDIDIAARKVDIEAGYDSLSSTRTSSASKTAVGGSVSIPLVDAVRGIQQMNKAASNTDDSRMQALAAATAAMQAAAAAENAQALASGNAGIKISVNLSNSKSKSQTTQSGQNAVGSNVMAGGDLSITAAGDAQVSDINVIGSQLSAGHDVKLKAAGDINLLAAQNTAEQHSKNGSSGWSAGVGFTIGGTQNGFTLELAANKSRGNADGADLSWSNTHVQAGNAMGLVSGGDTNLKGAIVSGERVVADIRGNLNIESLQDTSSYKSEQKSAGAGISLCIPAFCAGASSVSGYASQQKIDSKYASVIEQSGIKAGDAGFDLTVDGNTDLKGAVIASTDKAVAEGKNQLVTGSLTTSDIRNQAEYDASAISLGGGYSFGGSDGAGSVGKDKDGNAKAGAAGDSLSTEGGFSATTPIALSASDEDSSTTRSGISGGTIWITDEAKQRELTGKDADTTTAELNRDISSDQDGSHALKPIFDEEEILAGFEITTAFVQNVGSLLEKRAKEADDKKAKAKEAERQAGDYENGLSDEQRLALLDQARTLKAEANVINENWGAGGPYRQIATVLTAAAGGKVNASTSQFAQNMLVNYLQQQGAGYIGQLVEKGTLTEGSPLHATLHAIVGCAGAAASQQSCSAGALGGAASSVLTGLFSETSPDETSEQREAKRNLILTLVTGIAAVADPDSAATANNAATANVDNNWLATQQKVQRNKELAAAETLAEQLKVYAKWIDVSTEQNLATGGGLAKGLKDGLAGSGLDTLNSAARFMAFPVESLEELSELASIPAVKQLLGDKYQSFQDEIQRASNALETGGVEQAEQLGLQIGHLLATTISLVVAVEADAVKAAGELSRIGIAVSKDKLGALVGNSSEKLADQLAGLNKGGYDSDVPRVPDTSHGTGQAPTSTTQGEGGVPNTRPLRDRIADLSPSERALIESVETFKIHGVSNADALRFIQETPEGQKLFDIALKSAGPDADINVVLRRAAGFVETGVDLPIMREINTPLVKIVPTGGNLSGFSPFFTTQKQLDLARQSGRSLADVFGLPAISDGARFGVFEITPKSTATVFESVVAPTSELGGKFATGGRGVQFIVPDRNQFDLPRYIEVIDDNF
ncbi:MAG: hemagglutinin repeat-containing protein [Pseudomonas sp.]